MAYTTADLQALEAAIATGAKKVKYADKEVEYRSLEEMNQVRDQIRQELNPTVTRGRRRYATFSKGLK